MSQSSVWLAVIGAGGGGGVVATWYLSTNRHFFNIVHATLIAKYPLNEYVNLFFWRKFLLRLSNCLTLCNFVHILLICKTI